MNSICLVFIVFITLYIIKGQTNLIDSLINIVQKNEKTEDIREIEVHGYKTCS